MPEAKHLDFTRNDDQREILKTWWLELQELKGDRASLRRCTGPTEVIFQPAYHRLHRQLAKEYPVNAEKLATVVGLLSHVDEDVATKLGHRMADDGNGSRPQVSHLRFRRVLEAGNPDVLYTRMMRILKLLDGAVDLTELATKLYWWFHESERSKKDLAFDYYDQAPDPKATQQGA